MESGNSQRNFRKNLQGKVNSLVDGPLRFVLGRFYDMNFEGLCNIPDKEACIVVPKHCYLMDPIFVGLGLRSKPNIIPDYVMKLVSKWGSDLPTKILGLAGAKSIYKPRVELKHVRGKAERNKIKEEGRLKNEQVYSDVRKELSLGGCCVVFAEERLIPESMGNLKSKFFELGHDVSQNVGRKVSILPVGLEYKLSEEDKNEVNIRFGEPFSCEGDVGGLVGRCYKDVKKLSNL